MANSDTVAVLVTVRVSDHKNAYATVRRSGSGGSPVERPAAGQHRDIPYLRTGDRLRHNTPRALSAARPTVCDPASSYPTSLRWGVWWS